MTDKIQKTDWSKVDSLANPNSATATTNALGQPIVPDAPMAHDSQDIKGVIAEYKAGKIKKKAALDAYEKISKAQLTLLEHQLGEAVKSKKAEATMIAKEFLAKLDADYQLVLQGIGVANEKARQETLLHLGNQTSRSLKEVQEADWPQFMVLETVKVITARYKKFLDQIQQDLNSSD